MKTKREDKTRQDIANIRHCRIVIALLLLLEVNPRH